MAHASPRNAVSGHLMIEFGAWLSPVERCVRDAEIPGSNPGAPIELRRLEPSHNWYCTGLENRRPNGLVGSSPTGSAL